MAGFQHRATAAVNAVIESAVAPPDVVVAAREAVRASCI